MMRLIVGLLLLLATGTAQASVIDYQIALKVDPFFGSFPTYTGTFKVDTAKTTPAFTLPDFGTFSNIEISNFRLSMEGEVFDIKSPFSVLAWVDGDTIKAVQVYLSNFRPLGPVTIGDETALLGLSLRNILSNDFVFDEPSPPHTGAFGFRGAYEIVEVPEPIPEPGSVALFGGALAMMSLFRRRSTYPSRREQQLDGE
jgi:hypothetical protein